MHRQLFQSLNDMFDHTELNVLYFHLNVERQDFLNRLFAELICPAPNSVLILAQRDRLYATAAMILQATQVALFTAALLVSTIALC